MAELPPEGRAGVPQLLLTPHPRAVVCPIDTDLLAWYAALDAPDAIGWTGEEGDALVAELEGWGGADRHESDDGGGEADAGAVAEDGAVSDSSA